MRSSVVLLTTLLTAAAAAAAVDVTGGQVSSADDRQRLVPLHLPERLVRSSQRSAAGKTDAAANVTDAAAIRTDAAANETNAAANGTDAAVDADSSSGTVLRVFRPDSVAKDLSLTDASVGLQMELLTSHDHPVTSLVWTDPIGGELLDPRFLAISLSSNNSNSSLLSGLETAVTVLGKITLFVLLLCLAVAVFFALGGIGNTSQVYNRYGHYDPYYPWGPFTANGAIDQPGYKGRALNTGGGLAALLNLLEAALGGTAPCHFERNCDQKTPLARPARPDRALKDRPSRTRRSETGTYSGQVRRRIASPTASLWPPVGDRMNQQLAAAPRQNSDNGPVLGAVQSVVSLLVPVALLLPWIVILFFPGLLPAGDGVAVTPDEFPFDSDDDDNDRPFRRRLQPRRRRRRRRRDMRSGAP